MRLLFLGCLLGVVIALAACQNQTKQETITTEKDQSSIMEEGGQNHGEKNGLQDPEKIFNLTAEDIQALSNGRFLLTAFMNQTEQIAIPLADQWRLEKVEQGQTGRVFTFTSGEWILILEEVDPELNTLLYKAQVTGPDNLRYIADIRADGTIAPAQ